MYHNTTMLQYHVSEWRYLRFAKFSQPMSMSTGVRAHVRNIIKNFFFDKKKSLIFRIYGIRCETICPLNFYGPNCNVSCVAQDNCNAGHWMCNINGNKVCKPNWNGPNCTNKTITAISDPDCPNSLYANGGCQNGGSCFNGGCCCSLGFTG
jgi:hypothetical protein